MMERGSGCLSPTESRRSYGGFAQDWRQVSGHQYYQQQQQNQQGQQGRPTRRRVMSGDMGQMQLTTRELQVQMENAKTTIKDLEQVSKKYTRCETKFKFQLPLIQRRDFWSGTVIVAFMFSSILTPSASTKQFIFRLFAIKRRTTRKRCGSCIVFFKKPKDKWTYWWVASGKPHCLKSQGQPSIQVITITQHGVTLSSRSTSMPKRTIHRRRKMQMEEGLTMNLIRRYV